MKKIIRTMQGKELDFEKLILQNENVRAIGNMNVNGLGKDMSTEDEKELNRSRRRNNTYRRQIRKQVFDVPVTESKQDAEKQAVSFAERYVKDVKEIDTIPGIDAITKEPEVTPEPILGTAVAPVVPTPIVETPEAKIQELKKEKEDKAKQVKEENKRLQTVINKSSKGGGLASAIAKAKKVKQEQKKSPRDQLRADTGVKKI